ncbi:acyl-CoA dehydrogenase family protein [Acetobacter sp.]|uniref:acyl-CoA dehydrogenase family protein n=1 Tax=Acetobacter sp. TaxID=440 RepID=UPI0039EA75EB
MTQVERGWGSGPGLRYEELAGRFRGVFAQVRAGAADRDRGRILPWAEVGLLKEAGFTGLRVPERLGGLGFSLPELFNLLIELSEADPNLTNIFRSHLGLTEDLLNSSEKERSEFWLNRFAQGGLAGSGFSEAGGRVVGDYETRLVREGAHRRLNGRKFYTSGALFADWINFGAVDENDTPVSGLVPTHAAGVTIRDDWDGFGQALSASGTAVFENVLVEESWVHPVQGRCRYIGAFFQLVHLAALAGIGRALADDVARLVAGRKRVYAQGNGPKAAEDPQILQVVGQLRAAAYSAGAIVLKAAEAIQRIDDARLARNTQDEAQAGHIGALEVDQAVPVVTSLVLDASTAAFDALGASAASKSLGLDRHWRNARVIASHNPRIYRARSAGAFAVGRFLPQADQDLSRSEA